MLLGEAQYLELRDKEIYEGLITFFTLAKKYLWDLASPQSYIRKTIGVSGPIRFTPILVEQI